MMKKILGVIFLTAVNIFFFMNQSCILSETVKEEIKIYMGTAHVISVNKPMRIAIGNPNIADVAQVSNAEMTIVPKAAGDTTLVFWDNFGEQSYTIKVFSENTEELKVRIDKAIAKLNLSGISTKAEDEEGKVFLLGQFNTIADKDRAFLAMGPLKEKVVDLTSIREDEAVVEIDVQVLELNKGSSEKLGFTWPGTMTITELTGAAISAGGTTWGKLFNLGNLGRGAFNLTLDALVKEGKARILSRPRLSCLSGKEAKLLVGGEVPILSSSVTGGGIPGTTATPGSIEYKEYGIKLNIKPTVKENGRIYVNLGVEVSEVGTAVSTSYALAYPFTKRTANTELYLDDGQTMAIGGLIKQKSEEDLRKFPWLADVPVLGLFFRSRETKTGKGSETRDDSELFITLTPKIVSEKKAVNKITTGAKTETKRPAIDEASLDPVVRYSQVVQMRILENITYPVAGKGAGFQGTAKLGLKLSYKGELLGAKVISSSGYKILDDNALKTARSIPSYPPFPPAIGSEDLWIEVPIAYKLD
ncbi:MAG: TonB family protein [Candidatus Omnitrophota bacterium]|jgi:pilus assembly protein CpaC